MTIWATVTTRAAELLKLQEQLFLNLAVLFPLRPLQGQTAVTRSTSPSWLSSHFQLKLILILNWEIDEYQSCHLCHLVFGELGGRCWQVDSFHWRPETRQLAVVLAEVLIAEIFWDQFDSRMQKKWTFCNSIFRKWAPVLAHSTLSLPKVGLLVPITIRPNSNNWLCWSSPQSLSWLWRPYIRQREAIQCQRGPDWHSSDLGDHVHMAHGGHRHGYKSEIIHVHIAQGGYCHVYKSEKI